MAKLLGVDVYTAYACKSGTRLGGFQSVQVAETSEDLSGEDFLTVSCPQDDAAVTHLVQRRVLRVIMDDASFTEWRIQEIDNQLSESGNVVTVKAVSPLLDLLDAGLISETSATGVVSFDIGLAQVSVTEVIDNYIITGLPTEYDCFARGTIDPTQLFDVSWSRSTRLGLLRQLGDAARDSATLQPAEIRIRRNGTTNYLIDVLTQIGSDQAVADLRTQKNILRHRRTQDAAEMCTVILPFGVDGATIGRAAWKLDNASGLTYEITDPEGGQSPVLEDDQLNGMYVVPDGSAALIAITDSAAGSPATVTLASSTGITEGSAYELRADSSGTLNTELVSPSRVAAPPTGFGRKVRTIDRPDLHGFRNLVANPWFRDWAVAGDPPDGWAYQFQVPSGLLSQNTDALYTDYGGKSVRFTSGGTTTFAQARFASPIFYPRPAVGAEQYSYRLRVFPKVWTGWCTLSVHILKEGGVVSLGQHHWTTTNGPGVGGDALLTGDWFEIGLGGIDLTTVASSGARLVLTLQVGNATVAGAGSADIYIDAVMMSQDAAVPPVFVEFSGANAIHHAGNRALSNNRDGIDAYEMSVLDRTRADSTAYPFEGLVVGATIRDTVSEQSIDGQLLRILKKETNLLVPQDTKLQVATRQKLLSDLLSSPLPASGGGSVQVSGGGGGSGTGPVAPPGGGGGGGTTPGGTTPSTPTGGTTTPTLPLLKTIIADSPGVTTVLENFPTALTDLGDEHHHLVDLTSIERAYLSGVVMEDDGCLTGELREQYLRLSDSTWRYLDGLAGPELSMATVGRVQSVTAVDLEPDARGVRWCRLVAISGTDVEVVEVGHVALHGGSVPTPVRGGGGGGGGGGTPALTDFYDFNPTEGAGTAISDKQGSGLSMTTNGAWQAGDKIKYDIVGAFDFTCSVVTDTSLLLAPHSSMVLYFKAPAGFTVGTAGTLCGRKGTTDMGSSVDHQIRVDVNGNFNAWITTQSGGTPSGADVGVASSTVVAANGEYVVGMTHDGATLKLWVNGVMEDSATATDSAAPDATRRIIVGGGEVPVAVELPIDDMLIGRAVFANRGLTDAEMASLYAEFQAQYPGLP